MAKRKTEVSEPNNIIENCTFVGVQFDETAVNAIIGIAKGLEENAKALGTLAQCIKASNINLEAMLRVG